MWCWYRDILLYCARPVSIRGHQLPMQIVTFDGLMLDYGCLDL